MNKSDKTSEQTEQTTISSSLRFGLLGAALATIDYALATIAALEARDESIAADIQTKKDQQELDDKLEKLQRQIDRLTYKLSQIKKGREIVDSGSNFPFVFNHFNHFFNYIYKNSEIPLINILFILKMI